MNVPTAGQKRFVIVAATGMVGGYTLRYALEHPAVGTCDGYRAQKGRRRKHAPGWIPVMDLSWLRWDFLLILD